MTQSTDPAYERAAKRVKDLRDFYSHLIVYVLVNAFLLFLDIRDGDTGGTEFLGLNWAYWPLFGWGIAVVLQALALFGPARGWEERKLQALVEEERRRDQGVSAG